ncbi:MAG: acyltransferase family protein [Rhodocyclaceae bacterium]|nr:acyltransferase family protein [Rhodocyclaceae bacterium]
MSAKSDRDSLIDFIKALASQLIVVHHLALYGPMADAVHPAAPLLIGWIHDYALMAVQAFLVVGGYLVARSHAHASADAGIPAMLWRRYLRLMQPYAVALAAAIACAALARALLPLEDTPAASTLAQIAAHLLLIQDIVEQPSLSLGVWYVAIDFQLYALLLVLLRFGDKWATPAIAALTALSLLWLNRLPDLDMWAPYFFGAYGLGFLAQRIAAAPDRTRARRMAWLLALLVLAATLIDWRGRILVAAATAFLLLAGTRGRLSWRWLAGKPVAWLGRISYAVFLIHYPVSLAVGPLVARLWPDAVAAHAAGLGITWLLSLAAGTLLHNTVERRAGLRALRLSHPVAGTH